MQHRRLGSTGRTPPSVSEDHLPFDVAPVARRVPALRLDHGPAVRQPQRRRGVAAVGHELEPFAVGHEIARDASLAQQLSCIGCSLSKQKPSPSMTDGADAGRQPGIVAAALSLTAAARRHRRPDRSGSARRRAGCRSTAAPGAAARDAGRSRRSAAIVVKMLVVGAAQQRRHRRIHMRAIGRHILHRSAG